MQCLGTILKTDKNVIKKTRPVRRKRWRIILCLCILAALAAFISADLYASRQWLQVTEETVTNSNIKTPFHAVLISDLHDSVFGEDNETLVSKIRALDPDVIFIAGDLVNSDDQNESIAVNLIKKLAEIAPVYASMGNHEEEYDENFNAAIENDYKAAGATVLDRSYKDISINGQDVRIGGIYGYCMPEKFLKDGEAKEDECAFLEDFMKTDRYTILLCHMPYTWLVQNGLNKWDIGCVLAGHTHGGQIRFPLIGGLWAPDQGFWPGRESGLYLSDDGTRAMVLTRGLGSHEKIPRMNNRPEIVDIQFK